MLPNGSSHLPKNPEIEELSPFKGVKGQAWCFMPIIPANRRLRQEGYEFKPILGNIGRACLKKAKRGTGGVASQ
jgi:hypothetical protein